MSVDTWIRLGWITVDTWIKTSHIRAKLREASQIRLSTSSVLKEKEQKLITKNMFSLDPFRVGPAREICSGKEIDSIIVNGILNAGDLGNSRYR